MNNFDSKKAKQIACGRFHSAVLYTDGTFEFFGSDTHEQCTSIRNIHHKIVIQLDCGRLHSAVLYSDGTFKFFGNDT